MKPRLAPVLLPVLLSVAGCAGTSARSPESAADSSSPSRVVIGTTDGFRFTPATPTVRPGPVTVVLRNSGSYPHNIAFPELHERSRTVTGGLGRTSTVLHLTLDRPGTYRFMCTFHDQAGMTGALTVRN